MSIRLNFVKKTTPIGDLDYAVRYGERFELDHFCSIYGLDDGLINVFDLMELYDASGSLKKGEWLAVSFNAPLSALTVPSAIRQLQSQTGK